MLIDFQRAGFAPLSNQNKQTSSLLSTELRFLASQVLLQVKSARRSSRAPSKRKFWQSNFKFRCSPSDSPSNKSVPSVITVRVTWVKMILTQSTSMVTSGHSVKPWWRVSRSRMINMEASNGQMLIKKNWDRLLIQDRWPSNVAPPSYDLKTTTKDVSCSAATAQTVMPIMQSYRKVATT